MIMYSMVSLFLNLFSFLVVQMLVITSTLPGEVDLVASAELVYRTRL